MDQNTVFYAWQSDIAHDRNRYFIRNALKKALKQLERDDSIEECPRLDHDTKDVPGTPSIADTIFEKISKAKSFVADVTLIGKVGEKHVLNSNVAIELGYALNAVTADRLILVMNTAFGGPYDLPFDLRHRRHPICYKLADGASEEEVTAAKAQLANGLAEAIRLVLKIPEKKTPSKNLKINISPTRNGTRQLANIRLFNSGPGPIFIESWWIQWGPDGHRGCNNSISTVKGKLPVRLEEHAPVDILVEVGDNLEELTGIGVFDGEHHLWLADAGQLEAFKHQAIVHRLPPLPSDKEDKEKEREELRQCKVEIFARANSSVSGPRQRLEVLFKNQSEMPIPIRSAKCSWAYNPPRKNPSQPGKPAFEEAAGSVGLAPQSKCDPIDPGKEVLFVLEDNLSCFLVELCRGDVRDEGIKIEFVTSKGVGWTGTMEEIPEAVRQVAQSVLESMHNAQR